MAIGVIATLVLALVVVMVLLQTGGAKALSNSAALIGALVALGGVFTAQMVGIALDDRRTQEARDLEAQRANEAALQNYFEDVGELLIEKRLHRASPGDNLSTVVRAQTLSVLEGLDPNRKRILLLFLYESGLIYKRKAVVSLAAAKLNEAILRGALLSGTDLSEAILNEVVLNEANLSGARLRGADLRGANLNEAILRGADLSNADLRGASLGEAILSGANLSEAMLSGTNLTKAVLSETDMSGTNLNGANLNEAILSEANLSGANLRGANLSGATGVTTTELEQQAISLEGATMPDGSKHP